MALLHVIFAEGLDGARRRRTGCVDGPRRRSARSRRTSRPRPSPPPPAWTPTRSAASRASSPPRRAPSLYGRIGTTTQAFGTTTSGSSTSSTSSPATSTAPAARCSRCPPAAWRTPRARPAAGAARRFGRWASRVRGLPEVFGELPAAALAEEIDTPGDGPDPRADHRRGQPGALDAELRRAWPRRSTTLDFMVSIDIYVNETTRHADVILPAPSPLEKAHFDLVFQGFAVRNYANYSPPVLRAPGRDARRVGDGPAAGRRRRPARAPTPTSRRSTRSSCARPSAARSPTSTRPWHGRDVEDCLAELAPRTGTARMLDLLLRTGPYGLTLADLEAAPHGIDLGAAAAAAARGPAHAERPDRAGAGRRWSPTSRACTTRSPTPPTPDDARPRSAAATCAPTTRGCTTCRCSSAGRSAARCTSTPTTPRASALADGAPATRALARGDADAPVEVTDGRSGPASSRCRTAGATTSTASRWTSPAPTPGSNSNVLTDEDVVEPLTGTAVLNGIPVTLSPVPAPARRHRVAALQARSGTRPEPQD